jgi:hypothetical protein
MDPDPDRTYTSYIIYIFAVFYKQRNLLIFILSQALQTELLLQNGRHWPGDSNVGQNSIVTVTKDNLQLSAQGNVSISPRHGRRNFKDANPLMSSLLVIFVWVFVAIL